MTFGAIFDVKRFALHDGQGVRTTLFLKGCPLSCPWCQNPEGLRGKISLRWTSSKCIRCGQCVTVCPNEALSREEPELDIRIDHIECDSSGFCIDECPTAALFFDGQRVSAGKIADEMLRDRDFFDTSGGGITLSGGEPLAQTAFALEVLRLCKEAAVHTTVETSLSASHASVLSIMPYTDLFLVDQKIVDPTMHHKILGTPLEPIRENLEFLLAEGASVVIRIPLIPGFTATDENLRGLGTYIASLEHKPRVELLNFNPLAENKYRLLNHNWPIPRRTPRYTRDEMEAFASILRNTGVERTMYDN